MSAVRLLPMVVRSSVKRSKEGTPAGGFSPSSPSRTSRAHWCVTADMNCFVVCCCFFYFCGGWPGRRRTQKGYMEI